MFRSMLEARRQRLGVLDLGWFGPDVGLGRERPAAG
jgi:hypothetical protein